MRFIWCGDYLAVLYLVWEYLDELYLMWGLFSCSLFGVGTV